MPGEPQPPLILSFQDARHRVEEHALQLRPHGRELVELLDAAGCVLAERINADRDFPPFPRSTRDGYAVRAADLTRLPAVFEVVGEIKAGPAAEDAGIALSDGQVAAIMTGAPVPAGADAVVMVEYTSREANRVTVTKGVTAGDNVVPAGAEARRGSSLLSPGTRLDHAAISLAASVGRPRLLVHSRPRVAVLATGDEIVDIDVPPGPYQIRNSNSYSLAAQIAASGGDPMLLPIAADNPDRLRELIGDGLEADLLLITGGVSMGKHDLVEQALAEFQAEFFFTGTEIQPGRPAVFGRIPPDGDGSASSEETAVRATGKYFFGLPGNPVSTMVTFELFVRPMIEAMAGMPLRKLVFLRANLKTDVRVRTGLTRFLPAMLSGEFEHAEVELVPWQGSGDIAAMTRANCYLVIPAERDHIKAGESVPVLFR
jgi:molybdopterin molybdotransferase